MKIVGGAGVVERTGHLAQRLAHQPGLEADVAVAHLALDLGPGHQRGHRVDDDQVERAGADQHVGDLERLLTGVGLGDQQRVGVDAEVLGVVGVERVLGVDERHDAAGALGVGHRVQGDGRLAGGLRAVDLHHPAAREAAEAERDVERDRAGRDHLERRPDLVAEAHHRALAELLLDVGERGVERLVAVSPAIGCPLTFVCGRPMCIGDARGSHRQCGSIGGVGLWRTALLASACGQNLGRTGVRPSESGVGVSAISGIS